MRVELWYGTFKRVEHEIDALWQVEQKKKVFEMMARFDGYEKNYQVYLIFESKPTKGLNLSHEYAAKWFDYLLRHPKEEEPDESEL